MQTNAYKSHPRSNRARHNKDIIFKVHTVHFRRLACPITAKDPKQSSRLGMVTWIWILHGPVLAPFRDILHIHIVLEQIERTPAGFSARACQMPQQQRPRFSSSSNGSFKACRWTSSEEERERVVNLLEYSDCSTSCRWLIDWFSMLSDISSRLQISRSMVSRHDAFRRASRQEKKKFLISFRWPSILCHRVIARPIED